MHEQVLKEIARYTLLSGIAFGVDIEVFSLLRFIFRIDLITANIAARASGAIFAFLFNYYLTFTTARKLGLDASALRYLRLWLGSTTLSSACLYGLSSFVDTPFIEVFMKTSVEVAIMVMNFCVCKFWVYKS